MLLCPSHTASQIAGEKSHAHRTNQGSVPSIHTVKLVFNTSRRHDGDLFVY